jgi:hypothetical protein
MQPAIPTSSVPDKYFEILNPIYGMGRSTSSFKGHYMTGHTGSIGGIYSSISFMPADSIGIIVFTNRISSLPGLIAYTLYDKLLGLPETPWSDRNLKDYLKSKQTSREARRKPDTDRIPGTKPSHPLQDYTGLYEDPAYGVVKVGIKNDTLNFAFNQIILPLYHYHYDRFITPDDEINGKWSMTFSNDAQGSISLLRVSLDEKEVVFTRQADKRLKDPEFLKKLEGQYELNGSTITIALRDNELTILSAPPVHLDPYKGTVFRAREFSDQTVEFVLDEKGNSTGFRVTAEGTTVMYSRKN